VITIATPFKGSLTAKEFRYFRSAVDMIPGSAFLKSMYKKHTHNKLVCVSSSNDLLVDNSGTFLPGSKHVVVQATSHTDVQQMKNLKPVFDKYL